MIRRFVQWVKENLTDEKNSGLWLTPNRAKETPMLLYDGILTTDVQRYCEECVREYAFAVELRAFPNYEWYKTLKERTWYQTCDSMAGEYVAERKTPLYRVIHKSFSERDENHNIIGGGFLFLKDQDDYDKAVADLSDLMVDHKPFQTIINAGIMR